MAIPVFWMPASIAIANRSSCFWRKIVAMVKPKMYANHGRPNPATKIYKKIYKKNINYYTVINQDKFTTIKSIKHIFLN